VTIYPTTPTTTIGGVSIIVTASTVSFLFNSIEEKNKKEDFVFYFEK
jgi:hypothetical protein